VSRAALSPDQILLGPVPCTRCCKQIEPGAGRAVLVVPAQESVSGSPKVFVACIRCARSEAGLNNELAKHTSSSEAFSAAPASGASDAAGKTGTLATSPTIWRP
jgi:hypothetical protein